MSVWGHHTPGMLPSRGADVRIGWNGGGHHTSLDAIRDEARRAADDGFASFWLSQITGPDALTALAAVAADAPGIELGTSIVPALRTPSDRARGAGAHRAGGDRRPARARHRPVARVLVEGMFGETLRAIVHAHEGDVARVEGAARRRGRVARGEELVARGRLSIEAPPCPMLVAALGANMLDLAGREADGMTLWMVGPRTVADYVAPRMRDAAAAPGDRRRGSWPEFPSA